MAKCKDCFHWNACKKMLETYWGHCVPSDYEGGADRCEDFISTANVIVLTGIIEGHPDPVGEPGDNAIDVAKLEVAREIFEETMRAMESGIAEADKAVINNISVGDFRESLCRAGEMYAGYIGMAICKVFQKYAEDGK